jgi:histidinol-phosphate aminotransferase
MLREAAAEHLGLEPENIFAGNGSDEVLAFCFAAFFPSRGDAGGLPVLFPDITYSFYPVYAALWNVETKTIPLREDFSLNTEDYGIPNAGVLFPNPNAPTGIALSTDAMRRILEYQYAHQRVLIIDEAYAAFGAESMAKYVRDFDNMLVVQTCSKAASLAGLRVGYAAGGRALIEALERVRDSFNSYPVDTLAAAGAEAALRNWPYYEKINAAVIAAREEVSRHLRGRGWLVLPSSANFIFASPASVQNGSAENAAGVFQALREQGIVVRYFSGPRVKKFLRISIGSAEDMHFFLQTVDSLNL